MLNANLLFIQQQKTSEHFLKVKKIYILFFCNSTKVHEHNLLFCKMNYSNFKTKNA